MAARLGAAHSRAPIGSLGSGAPRRQDAHREADHRRDSDDLPGIVAHELSVRWPTCCLAAKLDAVSATALLAATSAILTFARTLAMSGDSTSFNALVKSSTLSRKLLTWPLAKSPTLRAAGESDTDSICTPRLIGLAPLDPAAHAHQESDHCADQKYDE